MTDDGEGVDLREFLTVLRRRRLVIVASIVVCVGLAVIISTSQQKVYEAIVTLVVQPRSAQQILSPSVQQPQQADRDLRTETQVMLSKTVEDAVGEELGRVPSVSADPIDDSNAIELRVTSSDKERVADEANTYARTYIDVRRAQAVNDLVSVAADLQVRASELQTQLENLDAEDPDRATLQTQLTFYQQQLDQLQVATNINSLGSAQIITEATSPTRPIKPDPVRNGVIGAFLGLGLGVLLAFAREHFDDTIKSLDDVSAVSSLPVLGIIPDVPTWKDRAAAYLVTVEQPGSPPAEAYRTFRTSLRFLTLDDPMGIVQVTSAMTNEGKTATVANLGIALAQARFEVIVVCCDLRRPRLHQFFGAPNDVGLTSVLLGETPVSSALLAIEGQPRLWLLASGPPPPMPSELLGLRRMADLLGSLRQRADFVLLDSPPVLPVSDPLVLSRYADATLVVGRAGKTGKRMMHRAVELLKQVEAPLKGIVLNDVSGHGGHKYGYVSYGYGTQPTYGAETPTTETPTTGNGRRYVRGTSSFRG